MTATQMRMFMKGDPTYTVGNAPEKPGKGRAVRSDKGREYAGTLR